MAELIDSRIDDNRGKKIDTYRNSDGSTYTIEVDWGTPKGADSPAFTAPGPSEAAYQAYLAGAYPSKGTTQAILQAGTARTGIGPTGQVGQGIAAGGPGTLSGALAADPAAYAAAMRPFTAPLADDTAARLAREEAVRQRKQAAQTALLLAEGNRRQAGAAATGQFAQYGVATPGAIGQLRDLTAPLTREQAAAQTGYGASEGDFDSIWQSLQSWYGQQQR